MKKLTFTGLAVCAILFASGCSKVNSATKLTDTGAVSKTVTFSVFEQPGEEGAAPPDLKKQIVFSDLNEWKLTESKKDQDRVLTAVRFLPAGSVRATDYTLEAGPGMKVVVSSVATKVSDDQIDYVETWKWNGKLKDDTSPGKDLKPILKADLAAFNPTDEQVDRGILQMRNTLFKAIFGPGDPLMMTFFSNPEGASRKLHVVMTNALLGFMKTEFPNATDGERLKAARVIAKKLSDDTSKQTAVSPENPPKEDNSSMTSVLVTVEGPGDLISSNGEYDVVDNTVFWQMFSDACMYEPVVLKASFKLK